ncbi:MAG: hypothetical protein ACLGHC_09135, partial [Alphaproteobacteria bacterium]
MAGRLGNLLAAHAGQLVDLLAELGRVGVERDQLADEAVDLLLEQVLLLLLERDQSGGLLGLDRLERLRRIQRQRAGGLGGGLGLGLAEFVEPRRRLSRKRAKAAPPARELAGFARTC